MKKIKYVILLMILFFIESMNVSATSGRLKTSSIKTCNGVIYGQHGDGHWHIAEKKDSGYYYPNGAAIYSVPCKSSSNTNTSTNKVVDNNKNSNTNTTVNSSVSTNNTTRTTTVSKSYDNTLKSIIIDGNIITISSSMAYTTNKDSVDVKVETNNSKATYEIENNDKLSIGKNEVTVKVTAENASVKKYIVDVNREVILSSDTSIKVFIDNKEVKFDNYKASINVESSTNNVSIDYTLGDNKATVKMNKINELKEGDNELVITVIAEDGTKKDYIIIINKAFKMSDAVSTVTGAGIIIGFGYGAYYLLKKMVKNK